MTGTDAVSSSPLQISAFRSVSNGRALAIILGVSAAVFAFLFWLVYFKPRAGYTSALIGNLPAVNALLNSLSSVFLVAGYLAIRRRRQRRHMRFMFAALCTSALFFVCYVVYHHFHGDTKFAGAGFIRPIYFFILITHIVLSAVAVPMILLSFFTSLGGRFGAHRRLSKVTLPIWLYVSVTGVLVFVMLRMFAR